MKFNTKHIIIRDDNKLHLRRPIIAEYISKQGSNYTVLITISHDINNNIFFEKTGNKVQLYDIDTKLKYGLYGKLVSSEDNKYDIEITVPEHTIAITSKWPENLPSNLPFEVKVISKYNIGEPSMWRVARYVSRVSDNKLFYLKLMPKDLIRGVDNKGQMDRVYKENDNQMKSKCEFVVSAICGEEGNFIWSLQEVAEHGSLLELKKILPDNIFPEYIALYLFKQIVLGVKKIHLEKILHNFLQLNIILIDSNFNVKISDFGASINTKNFTPFEDNYFHNLLPTFLNYKAKMVFPPEWKDKVIYNEQTDVWSLGIILKKLLTNSENAENVEEHISADVKDLINQLLNPNPSNRPSINNILKHPCMKRTNINKRLELNEITKELKLWLFSNYFKNTYKNTFNFNRNVSKEYIETYINEYLLSFVKTFAYDKNTGWNPILNTVWYHDQVTIAYHSLNLINITLFKSDEFFEIRIEDLLSKNLPDKYHQYISPQQWNDFKEECGNFIKKSTNKYFVNKDFKHFQYSDLENKGAKTFESLPSTKLLSNKTSINLSGNKNVLSLLIKVSEQQSKLLNKQGRVLSNKRKFNGTSFYIPLELCEKDIIANIMGSAWIEYTICSKKFKEAYCYLTVRVNNVQPSNIQGVTGWHVDGAWGEQTYRHNNEIDSCDKTYMGTFSDRNYIIQSSPDIKTPVALVDIDLSELRQEAYKKYNKGSITLLPTDKTDTDDILHLYLTHNIHDPPYQPPLLSQFFDKIMSDGNSGVIVELPDNKLNYFSASTVHNVPVNKTNKIIRRSTVRIAYSSDYFDKAGGPTINPAMGIPGILRFFPYPKPYKFDKNINLSSKII